MVRLDIEMFLTRLPIVPIPKQSNLGPEKPNMFRSRAQIESISGEKKELSDGKSYEGKSPNTASTDSSQFPILEE